MIKYSRSKEGIKLYYTEYLDNRRCRILSEIELKSNVIKTGRERSMILRFILASLVGLFMFFVPVTINGASSIMIDHIISYRGSVLQFRA
ncbi:hypothetical protein B1K97_04045 [Bacillus toyonensis]|nr:hypothetical protein B1K97_04045 [Bacillus toyonensis]